MSSIHRSLLLIPAAVLAGGRLSGAAEAPPTAGGPSALAERQAAAAAIANAGFEERLSGWQAGSKGFSVAAWAGRNGGAALYFSTQTAAARPVPSVRQTVEVQPGLYRLRFWLKLRLTVPDTRAAKGVRVSVAYYQNGKRHWPNTGPLFGTSDWQQRELLVLLPQGIDNGQATIRVHRYGQCTGEAWFDDFTLERLDPPPVELFLHYPNYRGYLPDDGPQAVKVGVKANLSWPTDASGRLEVTDSLTGRTIASVPVDRAVKGNLIELDASRWSPGRYKLQIVAGDYRSPPYVISRITAAQRRRMPVWFDQNNVLYLNGKPTFALGFYYAGGINYRHSPEHADLTMLAQAKLKLLIDYMSWAFRLDTQRAYLSELHENGYWFLQTVNNVFPGHASSPLKRSEIAGELLPGVHEETQQNLDEYSTRLAGAMRGMPAHAGWYVMDEQPLAVIEPTFHQYSVLRRADPDHPTYGVSNQPAELPYWRDCLDVFGVDPYPLLNMKLGRPLTMCGDWTRAAVQATQSSRPVWAVVQFFQGFSKDRWPTEEELRTMSLMAVTEGARGLFYWTFGVRGLSWVKNKEKQAEYWRRAVAVCQELKRLEPALIAADSPEVVATVSDQRVRWRARAVRQPAGSERWYVFFYLPAEKLSDRFESQPTRITFTLKDGQRITRPLRPDTADWFDYTP